MGYDGFDEPVAEGARWKRYDTDRPAYEVDDEWVTPIESAVISYLQDDFTVEQVKELLTSALLHVEEFAQILEQGDREQTDRLPR